jgi:hypothetical protein
MQVLTKISLCLNRIKIISKVTLQKGAWVGLGLDQGKACFVMAILRHMPKLRLKEDFDKSIETWIYLLLFSVHTNQALGQFSFFWTSNRTTPDQNSPI